MHEENLGDYPPMVPYHNNHRDHSWIASTQLEIFNIKDPVLHPLEGLAHLGHILVVIVAVAHAFNSLRLLFLRFVT